MVAFAHRWCNLSAIVELGSLRSGEAAAKGTAHNQKCCGKKQRRELTDMAEKWTIQRFTFDWAGDCPPGKGTGEAHGEAEAASHRDSESDSLRRADCHSRSPNIPVPQ